MGTFPPPLLKIGVGLRWGRSNPIYSRVIRHQGRWKSDACARAVIGFVESTLFVTVRRLSVRFLPMDALVSVAAKATPRASRRYGARVVAFESIGSGRLPM